MLFEIKAVLLYFQFNCLVNLLKGRLKYMDLAIGQARPLIGGLVATIATMAEMDAKNQNGFAGQPCIRIFRRPVLKTEGWFCWSPTLWLLRV